MLCDICHNEMDFYAKDLRRCQNDGLISSVLKARVEIYDKEYHQKHVTYAHNDIDVELQRIRTDFVLKNTEEHERGEILDIGCGNGSFLRSLDGNFGIKRGFDINPYENFTRIDFLLQSHDVITLWDCIEHLESPFNFLRGLRANKVFITSPQTDCLKTRDDMMTWRHYRPHEHVHYFNLQSLTALLNKCGYEIIDYNFGESTVRKAGGENNLLSIAGKKNV